MREKPGWPAWSTHSGVRSTRVWRQTVGRLSERLRIRQRREQKIIEKFNWLYYNSLAMEQIHWLGVRIMKPPDDLWAYQEIIHETRPDVIVETGTAHGGSSHYMATLCDIVGNGRVLTIDTREHVQPSVPAHPRLTFIEGSSIDDQVAGNVRQLIEPGERVMVVLDSAHQRDHVLAELDLYAPLVAPGCYLIVEDTNLNGHPAQPGYGPGPWEALEKWLPRHPEFTVDRGREKHLRTFHPGGYLRRD